MFLFVFENIKAVKQSENTLKMYIYFFLIHSVPSLPLLDHRCSLKLGTMGQPATNPTRLLLFMYLPRFSNEFQSRWVLSHQVLLNLPYRFPIIHADKQTKKKRKETKNQTDQPPWQCCHHVTGMKKCHYSS